ncbi:hypothetical protein FRC09_001153, partial [Ceratobasidium sp. 395]
KKSPILNRIHDAFNALEENALPVADLVKRTTRLATVLSECVPLLYESRARPTLAFCGSAIESLYETKLKPAAKSKDRQNTTLWEETMLNGLIQPILEIVDPDGKDAGLFGETLYPAICRAMRSGCAAAFGGRFAHSLALVLLETCSAPENKRTLLDQNVFGVYVQHDLTVETKLTLILVSTTLSKLIIDAKSYHHLDTLLELSFRMFSRQDGANTRESYAKNLFDTEYASIRLTQEVCAELSRIHAVTSGNNSEQHVLDIIRAMSSVQVQRPQVFSTQDLSYRGTKYTQRAPSNVMVLDDSSVSIIICDKASAEATADDETDVLAVPFASIEKVELAIQDDIVQATRTLAKFIVSEAPLISSIRAPVETPTGRTNGAPLCLCVSVASSDVSNFEAALAARNLAKRITGDGLLIRHASTMSTKISHAVSDIGLSRAVGGNLSQERVEEMMNKYVNIPSSPDPDPTLTIVAPKRRPGRPKKLANTSSTRPLQTSRNTASSKLHDTRQAIEKATHASEEPATSTGRPRRACAARATEVIQKQTFESPDNSEVSEPEITPEQPRRTGAVQNTTTANNALPTPPNTRSSKLATKTLALNSPTGTKAHIESPSSPISEVTSPTAKVVSKRKRVEEDPIEPSIDTPEHEGEKVQKFLPSSQYITPRDTAATRAKAKYTTNAKRMRISSPDPELELDIEGPPQPDRINLDDKLGRSGDVTSSSSEEVVTAAQPSLDKSDLTARSTRSTAKSKKPETVAKAAPIREPDSSARPGKPVNVIQTKNKPAMSLLKEDKAEPKTPVARANPSEDKSKGAAQPSERIVEKCISFKSPIPTSKSGLTCEEPAISRAEEAIEYVDVDTISVVGDTEVEANDAVPSSEDDEPLAALSQAAKKATRRSLLEPGPVRSYLSSPTEEVSANVDKRAAEGGHVVGTNEDARLVAPETPGRQTRSLKAQPVDENRHGLAAQAVVYTRQQEPIRQEESLVDKPSRLVTKGNALRAPKDHQAEEVARTSKLVVENPTGSVIHSERHVVQERLPPVDPRSNGVDHTAKTPPEVGESNLELDARGALEPPNKPTNWNPSKSVRRTQDGDAPTKCPPAENSVARRLDNNAAIISIDIDDADSEVEELPKSTFYSPVAKPVFRQTTQMTPLSVSATPSLKSQHKVTLQAPARIKPSHPVFDRLAHSPKSALASPGRSTFSRKGRPSVSFVDKPSLTRRSSSDSSATHALKYREKDERAKLLAGASVRTGSVLMQIVEVLDAIQMTIVENLGEKVQMVTTEAHNARVELARTVITKLEAVQAHAERHYGTLHEFEGIFATQTQEFLDGCNRVNKCNTKIDAQVQEAMTRNARAGQSIAKAVIDFELPEGISAHLASSRG